jgi:hypothetical protein
MGGNEVKCLVQREDADDVTLHEDGDAYAEIAY